MAPAAPQKRSTSSRSWIFYVLGATGIMGLLLRRTMIIKSDSKQENHSSPMFQSYSNDTYRRPRTQPARPRPKKPVEPLPKDPNYQSFSNLMTLPAFTSDNLAYVYGSTLTREATRKKLVVDVFFMGKKVVNEGSGTFPPLDEKDLPFKTLKKEMEKNVMHIENQGWGCRFNGPFPFEGGREAKGVFVPVGTTVDGNVNDMINILRCELPAGLRDSAFKHKRGDLEVEVFEVKSQSRTVSSLNFTMPIDKRTTGYINYEPTSSLFDPWQDKIDNLHLCVPGLRSTFESPFTELVLEFVEYHMQQGVDHIFFGVDYEWGSRSMRKLELLLEQYITEGRVSISSYDVIKGAEVHSEPKKVMHMNQCLYFSKGTSKWVGVWDVDELLIPRTPPGSIMDVINRQVKSREDPAKDMCHILLTSYSHALPQGGIKPREDGSEPKWLGEIYADTREEVHDDGWQKSILSAEHVWYTGFHLPGSCSANGHDWTLQMLSDHPDYPTFSKHVNKTEAAMYHFRAKITPINYVRSTKFERSEYADLYFAKTLNGIKKRKMDEVLKLLETKGY